MIDRFDETRHLVKIQVFYDGKNAYSFNYEGKVHVFRGTVEELAKFLQSFKAKDNKTTPRSYRGERYIDIANEITDGTDNIIFAWSNDLMNVVNKRESFEEAVNLNKADVFVFSNINTLNLFVDMLKDSDEQYLVKDSKVFVDPSFALTNMDKLAGFFDAHMDDFVMYSNAEYTQLKKQGVKIESISKLTESDEMFVDGKMFKSFGLYDRVGQMYNNSWADALLKFADDKICQKAGFYLMCDETYTFLEIRKMNNFEDWISFMVDKNGEEPGTFIKFGFNGVFSQQFAKSKTVTFIGMENNELVIKAGSTYLHTLEDVQESVRFTAEGPEISNDDHKILDDLFTMLDGDPNWEVDTDHGRCSKNDGSGYFQVKGNEILLKSGRAEAKVSWVKGTKFLLQGDGTVVVTFGVPGSEGRFEI